MDMNDRDLSGSKHFSDSHAPFEGAADLVWSYMTSIKNIQRRDGRIDAFDPSKIERSIRAAFASCGLSSEHDLHATRNASEQTLERLTQKFNGHRVPTAADVREAVATTLIESHFENVARNFLEYRNVRFNDPATPTYASANAPRRKRLNEERKAITHKFQIGNHEGYLTVGLYDDTRMPGEIFLRVSKEGSSLSGHVDAFATAISIGLQYGVPLKVYVNKFANMRFEPSGPTQNPNIPNAKSIVDYVFRWLALKFLTPEERQSIGVASDAQGATSHAYHQPIDRQPKLLDPLPFDTSRLD